MKNKERWKKGNEEAVGSVRDKNKERERGEGNTAGR